MDADRVNALRILRDEAAEAYIMSAHGGIDLSEGLPIPRAILMRDDTLSAVRDHLDELIACGLVEQSGAVLRLPVPHHHFQGRVTASSAAVQPPDPAAGHRKRSPGPHAACHSSIAAPHMASAVPVGVPVCGPASGASTAVPVCGPASGASTAVPREAPPPAALHCCYRLMGLVSSIVAALYAYIRVFVGYVSEIPIWLPYVERSWLKIAAGTNATIDAVARVAEEAEKVAHRGWARLPAWATSTGSQGGAEAPADPSVTTATPEPAADPSATVDPSAAHSATPQPSVTPGPSTTPEPSASPEPSAAPYHSAAPSATPELTTEPTSTADRSDGLAVSRNAGRCVKGLCGLAQLQPVMVLQVVRCIQASVLELIKAPDHVGSSAIALPASPLSWLELRTMVAAEVVPAEHWDPSYELWLACPK